LIVSDLAVHTVDNAAKGTEVVQQGFLAGGRSREVVHDQLSPGYDLEGEQRDIFDVRAILRFALRKGMPKSLRSVLNVLVGRCWGGLGV
jgi:predicted hotdog family 3-hydroxylacyl-ACP dehydratase